MFLQNDIIESFHSLPRFSHHDDFSALFSSDADESRDYAAGLIFVACWIMSIFTAWGWVILFLKCLGPFYVGVFSGYPYQDDNCTSRTGRGMFLFSSLMVILFSILATTQGLTKLENTAGTVDATNQDVIKIRNELSDIVTVMRSQAHDALPVRDEIIDFLGGDICPLVNGHKIFLRQTGQQVFDSLTTLDNFLADELTQIEKALRQVTHANTEIDNTMEKVEFTTGVIVGIMIPFFIVPSLLIACLLMGWAETYYDGFFNVTEWLIMPFFVVMIIFAYLACGCVMLATESNADFCSGGVDSSPESTILNIMGRYNLEEGELYYDVINFYSHQCSTESLSSSPFAFLEQYYNDLLGATESIRTFQGMIDTASSLENLSQECGVDYNAYKELLLKLQAHSDILGDASRRSLELMSCRSIVPLYTNLVYDATCDENMTAALWLFSCSLIISFFGMVMITLRGACYPLLVWDDDDEKGSFYSTESSNANLHEISSGEEVEVYEEEETDLYLDENGGAVVVGTGGAFEGDIKDDAQQR